jgi:hypothetical protein
MQVAAKASAVRLTVRGTWSRGVAIDDERLRGTGERSLSMDGPCQKDDPDDERELE